MQKMSGLQVIFILHSIQYRCILQIGKNCIELQLNINDGCWLNLVYISLCPLTTGVARYMLFGRTILAKRFWDHRAFSGGVPWYNFRKFFYLQTLNALKKFFSL